MAMEAIHISKPNKMPIIKIYYLKEKRGDHYIAHIDRVTTRTINVHTAAHEFDFENDDEANGFCKALKMLTGSDYIPVRKRKNM